MSTVILRLGIRLSAATLLAFVASASWGAECLRDNVESQSAEGRLSTGKFRDAAGRPEDAMILRLLRATCLRGEDAEDNAEDVRAIHVYAGDAAVQRRLQQAIGKTVRVEGRPFRAHTAHHHAPVVMEVSSVRTR